MEIIVDNTIRIINGIKNDSIMNYCISELQIKNPEYLQNQRLGFSVYKIPKTLSWYEIRGNDVVVPFGCLKKIYSLYPWQQPRPFRHACRRYLPKAYLPSSYIPSKT